MRLQRAERWMRPRKSDGSQTVTSASDAECTSSWNLVGPVGRKFRHWDEGKPRRHCKDRGDGTYDFDLDRLCPVTANEDGQAMVARLIAGTIVRENKGDINRPVICLQCKVPC